MAFEIIQTLLTQSGYRFSLHDHPAVTTIEDARQKVPHLTVNLIKTIVFRIKEGHWVLAGVGADDRIDYKALASAFGVNRKKLRSISTGEVEEELGFQIGGVGPFPVTPNVRVILDQGLAGLGFIFCGSGKNTATIGMDIQDLIRVSGAMVSPICKEQKKTTNE